MLKDKIAVVTGGTRGIGYAIVKKYLENGAKVILFGSRPETVEKALSSLKSENPSWPVEGFHPNLSDAKEVAKTIEGIKEKYGRIDILVNNAGISDSTKADAYEDGQFENLIRPVENPVILEAVCRRLDLDKQAVEREAAEQQKEQEGKKRILVVDDNGTTLRTMKAMLEEHYEVAVAISGAQAMTSIGKKRPDLILLDYEMPVCDGRMTLEMIRADEDLKDIPVIFLTAVNDRANIEAVLKLKPAGYFLKPAVKDQLRAELQKVLGR